MPDIIALAPVDRVEITTLYDNLVDMTAARSGPVELLRPATGAKVATALFEDEPRTPFVGGHRLSMLVRVTRDGVTRSLLFDAGGSPDGLVHNLDCLDMRPNEWSCIVLSHGHSDHTLGLIGLHKRMGRLGMPLTLHPDAWLKRSVALPSGEFLPPMPSLTPAGLRDAGLDLIETDQPSFVLEGMALVTGQVARTNTFETGWPAHFAERAGALTPDPLICDDQGLVIHLRGKGLVVLSGCGHAGIVNTVAHARTITGVAPVHAVIGGFHLSPAFFHDRIAPVVEALVSLNPAVIAPAHCTRLPRRFRCLAGAARCLCAKYRRNPRDADELIHADAARCTRRIASGGRPRFQKRHPSIGVRYTAAGSATPPSPKVIPLPVLHH